MAMSPQKCGAIKRMVAKGTPNTKDPKRVKRGTPPKGKPKPGY